jgi:PAS domain S-box-containing protein
MKHEESRLDDLFHEFQSSSNKATPEERNSLDSSRQEMKNLVESKIDIGQIAENIEQVFWLKDIHSGQYLYISPAFEMVWGRSTESLYADPSILIESVHPEDRVQVMVAESHYDKKPISQTYRILRPDGSIRWISARTILLRNEAAEATYIFCIAQDITDQKQVELALRNTVDRIREQFDLSHKMSLARKPEAVLKTLMFAHELRSAQRAALLFFDDPTAGPDLGVELLTTWQSNQNLSPWSSESILYEEPALWELFQRSRTVVISGIQADPRLAPVVRDFLLEGQVQTLAIFPLIASGSWLGCLLVYYHQEHDFDPIDLRHLKILVDQAAITLHNLRLLEVEAESRLMAEHANEIKTEFLAMITHELRTPLTSIIGFTTTLLAEDVVWDPDEQNDFIETIQREARRLQELIDHLLDLSRLEAGMMPILQKPHSLQEILIDALPQFQTLTSGQDIQTHLPDNLPLVNVDAKRIAQVLVNLVRNAATYAPNGTEISISASIRGGFVQLNVNDQGPGIPPAEHKRVFKAFQRGENVEFSSMKGAGLGLAICKGLVEAHGGRIWIKKKAMPGTTVSFTIPIVPAAIPAIPAGKEI